MVEDTRYKIDMEEISVNNTAPSTELKYQLQLNELEASLLEMKVKVDELIKGKCPAQEGEQPAQAHAAVCCRCRGYPG